MTSTAGDALRLPACVAGMQWPAFVAGMLLTPGRGPRGWSVRVTARLVRRWRAALSSRKPVHAARSATLPAMAGVARRVLCQARFKRDVAAPRATTGRGRAPAEPPRSPLAVPMAGRGFMRRVRQREHDWDAKAIIGTVPQGIIFGTANPTRGARDAVRRRGRQHRSTWSADRSTPSSLSCSGTHCGVSSDSVRLPPSDGSGLGSRAAVRRRRGGSRRGLVSGA